MGAAARVPCQIRRGPRDDPAGSRPAGFRPSRQPTGCLASRSGSGNGSDGQAAESAARAARRAALTRNLTAAIGGRVAYIEGLV